MAEMEPIRIALIGCGGIAGAHRNAYLQIADEAKVVVACDVSRDAAENRAAELGAVAMADYREALARPDVEAIDICLPHHLHAPIAIEAAKAGKHIFTEKPMANMVAEADAMIQAAEAAGVILMIGHNQRYAAARQTAHRLVDEGAIGDIYLMRTDHNQFVNPSTTAWRADPAKAGGGAMADSGIHQLDQLLWFCGPATRVSASLARNGITSRPSEDAGIVTLEHASGAISELTLSWTAHRSPWYEMFFIYGTKGVIHSVGGLQLYAGTPREGEFQVMPLDHDDQGGFREELRHFAHCVRTGQRPLTDGYAGRAALQIVQALYESASSGTKVTIPA